MALIACPECGKQISDKAEACPHCGLPSAYFKSIAEGIATQHHLINQGKDSKEINKDYKNLNNAMITFDKDYHELFSSERYISTKEKSHLKTSYEDYYNALSDDLIMQYTLTNASKLRIDIEQVKSFKSKYSRVDMTGSPSMPLQAQILVCLHVFWN